MYYISQDGFICYDSLWVNDIRKTYRCFKMAENFRALYLVAFTLNGLGYKKRFFIEVCTSDFLSEIERHHFEYFLVGNLWS